MVSCVNPFSFSSLFLCSIHFHLKCMQEHVCTTLVLHLAVVGKFRIIKVYYENLLCTLFIYPPVFIWPCCSHMLVCFVTGSLKEAQVRAWKDPAWKHNCGYGPWWNERDDWNALGNIPT
ncbi:citrate synthase1 [Zea mays]|uniref:Citrate synthase1 n=1 Tax=Zea mays TaxID=4577 RepID=A0A1D6H4D2_MAIZE|nr:citrate synthase1 [Zea mays]